MTEEPRRYLCVNCDLGFDVAADSEPRCPRCMRKNIVEQPRAAVVTKRPVKFVLVATAVGLVVALVGGYLAWSNSRPSVVGENVPSRPLEEGELRGHLRRLEVDRPELRALFESNADVRALFGAATRREPADAVRAMHDAIARLARSGRVVAASPRGERQGAFLVPGRLAHALRAHRGRVEISSVEATLLAVVALREADVDARVAEVWGYEGGGVPDPSGLAGRYFVEVPGRDGRRRALVDVFESDRHTGVPKRGASRTLNDIQAVAAALTVQAMVSATRDHDGQTALAGIDEALRLDPRSVVARTARAMLLATTGAGDAALEEARAAEAMRPDAPRLAFHASLALASGDASEGEALTRRALALAPDFVPGHAMLASIHLARNQTDAARAELDIVERGDPASEGLPALWAAYFILTGHPDEAARRIDAMVAAHPDDPMVRLQAAYTLIQGGMREQAVAHLRRALTMVEGPEREALRDRIGSAFGIGILGELTGPVDAGTPSSGVQPTDPGAMRLDMPQLGGARRPSLLHP